MVRLAFWNSEHEEIWKWDAAGRQTDAVRTDRRECRNSYVDEGQKGQHIVLATEMPSEIKFPTQCTNSKEFIKESTLNVVYSVLAFVANKGQNKSKSFVFSIPLA